MSPTSKSQQEFMNMIHSYIVLDTYKLYCKEIYTIIEPVDQSNEPHIMSSNIEYATSNESYSSLIEKNITNQDIWDKVFRNIKAKLTYYETLYIENPQEESKYNYNRVYKSKTFQEHIDDIGSLQKLGPYDYMEFYKSMKDSSFRDQIYNNYLAIEKYKKMKNSIISDMIFYFSTPPPNICAYKHIDLNLNPFYLYLYEHKINISEVSCPDILDIIIGKGTKE